MIQSTRYRPSDYDRVVNTRLSVEFRRLGRVVLICLSHGAAFWLGFGLACWVLP